MSIERDDRLDKDVRTRVPIAMYSRVVEICKAERTSMSRFVRLAIEDRLKSIKAPFRKR